MLRKNIKWPKLELSFLNGMQKNVSSDEKEKRNFGRNQARKWFLKT